MKALVSVERLGWRALAGLVAALALTLVGAGGAAASTTAKVRAHVSAQSMTQIRGSLLPTTAAKTGTLSTSQMSVEVVLAAGKRGGSQLPAQYLYTPGSADYGHWLAAGQFDSEFAPSQATVNAVTGYLQSQGLTVQATSTPFLLRAIGNSAQIDAAFATTLDKYRNAQGVNFYSNATPASVPASLASSVLGVVGLTNTVRLQSQAARATASGSPDTATGEPSCEIPYPTTLAQLQAIPINGPFNGYGGGPGCSGLTPSQTNSIYNAPNAGPRGKGAGANVAVFELSAYNHSDITNWAHTFYGSHYSPAPRRHQRRRRTAGSEYQPVPDGGHVLLRLRW